MEMTEVKLEFLGKNLSEEKVKEVFKIIEFIGEEKPENIIIKDNDVFKENLTYFNPNGHKNPTILQLVDNLLYTCELNPTPITIIKIHGGKELKIGWEDEILEECYDVLNKLQNVVDTLRSGKELDSTQNSFLKIHNIIK